MFTDEAVHIPKFPHHIEMLSPTLQLNAAAAVAVDAVYPCFALGTDFFPPKLLNFPPKSNLGALPRKAMASPPFLGLRVGSKLGISAASGGGSVGSEDGGVCTLMECIGAKGYNVGDDLAVLFGHLEYACKRISALVASPFNSSLGKNIVGGGDGSASGRDKPKPLDIVSVSLSNILDFASRFHLFLKLFSLLDCRFGEIL